MTKQIASEPSASARHHDAAADRLHPSEEHYLIERADGGVSIMVLNANVTSLDAELAKHPTIEPARVRRIAPGQIPVDTSRRNEWTVDDFGPSKS